MNKNSSQSRQEHRADSSSESLKTSELKAAQWQDYRMWRRGMNAVANSGSSAEWLGDWRPTDILFRARSQAEAQKKADKFWRDGQFGAGSMLCVPANEDLRLTLATVNDEARLSEDSIR